jgi:hypothetical protein
MFKPAVVPGVSGVTELYRSGMSIDESQVVGIRSSRELEPEWLLLDDLPTTVAQRSLGP